MKQRSILFLAGGSAYVLLELAFRQHSHITMFFAGGTCFLLIHRVCNYLEKFCTVVTKCISGSLIITLVELAFGMVFNRDYSVWDYSALPMNFQGQICLPFSLIWALLTFPAMKLGVWMEKIIKGKGKKARKKLSV